MKGFSFISTSHSLLKLITLRIGKFCQNKDDMTCKSSRGKETLFRCDLHSVRVLLNLCTDTAGVMSLYRGIIESFLVGYLALKKKEKRIALIPIHEKWRFNIK